MRRLSIMLSCALLACAAALPIALAEHHGNEEFLRFLAEIDDGKGPAPEAITEPPTRGVQDLHVLAWQSLGITHELQRKDTKMLCLDGCDEIGAVCWDNEQVDHNGHGSHYCVRASIQMINAHYGGTLSQDRMTHWIIAEYPDSNKKALEPDFDLWHSSGSKAVISTENHGRRLVFVEESASSYHFDRGRSQLRNGSVTIHLDPIFLQTVTLGDGNPPVVRVTPTADCLGLYVARWTATSFTVQEIDGGTSNAAFNWEVAAKRRGFENVRLDELTAEED